MSNYQPDIIIYHHPCSDGFAAAWSCWKKWGDSPEYVGANYGAEPPEVEGKHVLIVDFSYKKAVLNEMAQEAASIVVLDHHKTAEEDLRGFSVGALDRGYLAYTDIPDMQRDFDELGRPPVLAHFDMNRSGAMLAWRFCFPDDPVGCLLVRLVEDRDLWKFEIEGTKAFALLLKTAPETFEAWDDIGNRASEEIFNEADGMLGYQSYLVDQIASNAHWIEKGGHRFLAVNCPSQLSSEVCHKILTDNMETPFAGSWNDGPTHRGWSLRSTNTREDVSKIAQKFGGGGHRNAAGFGEPLPTPTGQ